MRTREGNLRAEVTKNFNQRNTRIDEHPAVPDDPQDHAVTGGRDESFRYEGGHSPEYHTIVLENTKQQIQRTSQTSQKQNTLL